MVEECSDPKWNSWGIKFDFENMNSNFEENTIFIKKSHMNVWIATKRAAGSKPKQTELLPELLDL